MGGKTIVLKTEGAYPYRRIDLARECTGLKMSESFTSATTISQRPIALASPSMD